MEALIAKRYVKALRGMMDGEALAACADIFEALSDTYAQASVKGMLDNPQVPSASKEEVLLSAVAGVKSATVDNLLKLLVEKRRIALIPAIAEALRLELAEMNKRYVGKVYSASALDAGTMDALKADLGKKVDATIELDFVQSDIDGIKVEVEDLGLEINLSKSRLNAQLAEHILKAI